MILFITSLLTLVLDLVSIAVVFPFLSLFMNPGLTHTNKTASLIYAWGGFSGEQQFLIGFGIFLIAAFLVKFIAKIFVNKARYRCSNSIVHRLATGLFSDLMDAQYALFTEQSTTEMVVIINTHSIHSTICLESFVVGLTEISFMALLIIIFFVMNPFVTAIVIAVFIFISVVIYVFLARRINETGELHSRYCNQVHSFGFVMANSIKDIKIMGLEKQYRQRFNELCRQYCENIAISTTLKAIPKEFSETLVLSSLVLICLIIAMNGDSITAVIPVIGFLVVSIMRALPSFNNIIRSYNEYNYYRSSLKMVENLFKEARERTQKINHVDIPFSSELSVRDLAFSYNDKPVLKCVSLKIEKGQSVAIVGSSGSGKSTLLDVLAGLREPQKGFVSFDGVSFNPFTTDALKSKIGYVPQSVSLADESVAFNIAFTHEYDKGKMALVLRMARLDGFVSELSDGTSTLLGESGVRVSGGQRQRIGIARALYRDPEILMFDEATSALDNLTELELMQEIQGLARSKTLIIVAHRLSTVEDCDVIFLLESGRLVASGSHQQLLETSVPYRELYTRQREREAENTSDTCERVQYDL